MNKEKVSKKVIHDALEEIYAVLLLEYHDKNLLYGDNKARNEWMRERVLGCMVMISNYEIKD